jgi:hypothetical protein
LPPAESPPGLSEPLSQEVRALRDAARALHRELLAAVRRRFEKLHRRVQGPGELLELAVHDPLFAWLKPLSTRLVELEELDLAAVDRPRLAELREGFGRLLDADAEFAPVYRVYLQAEPGVVMAHAELRRALQRSANLRTPS